MADKKVRRGIELYIDGKEVVTDIRAIEAEARKLTKEIKKMTIGSDEYVAAQKRIKECNAILMDHRAGLKAVAAEQRSLIQIAGDLANRYLVLWASVSAALTSVLMVWNKFRTMLNEREDTKADVKALTGLDDESISWLEKKAVELSTTITEEGVRIRQSATEILDAFKLVGSAKPDLLQNKEALAEVTKQSLILAQASGMDLKHAVDAVTLSMNQYGAAANEAARYANVMAAGSKYGSAAVDAVTIAVTKSGVAASSANIPIEQLVGSIEALAERGIKNEVAGTGLKSFFLRLEKGAADTRPSVVGLQQALENLANKGLSSADMIKQFGLVGYTVAQAMISSAEKVAYYTGKVTDTQVAMEQAGIKSETAAAKMEQAKNRMAEAGMELASQLQPIFIHFVGWTSKIIRTLPVIVNWIKKYSVELTTLAAIYLVCTLRMKVLAAVTTAYEVVIKTIKNTVVAFRLAMELTSEAMAGCSLATTRLSTALASSNILVKTGTALVALMKAAYALLTFNLNAASNAIKVFNTALASTGWGAVIVGIGAAVGAIYKHTQAVKAARQAEIDRRREEYETLKQYYEESATIEHLKHIIDDENSSLAEKKQAIEKLKEIYPDYNAQLSEEGQLIKDNRQELDKYLDSLKKKILYEANEDKLKELYKQKQEAEDEETRTGNEYWRIRQQNTLQGVDRNSVGYKFMGWISNSAVGKAMGWDKDSEYGAKNAYDTAQKQVQDINNQIDAMEAKIGKLAEDAQENIPDVPEGEGNGEGSGEGGGSSTNKETDKEKKIKEALLAIDALYDQKAAELKKKYIEGDIATEQDYTDRLQANELARMDAKLKIAGLEPEQRAKFLDKMMDMEVNIRKKIDSITTSSKKASEEKKLEDLEKSFGEELKLIQDAYELGIIPDIEKYHEYLHALYEKYNDDKQALLEKQADKRLKEIEDEEAVELSKLKLQLAQRLLTQEEYEEAVIKLKKKYLKKKQELENKSKDATSATEKEEIDILIEEAENQNNALEEYADKLRDIAEEYMDIFSDLGENLADALFGDDKKKAWKDLGKEFLKDALSMVEKYIMIKQAQIMADAIANASTIAGVAKAILKATAKMAAIKASFALAKGAVSNFWTGGFTPDGKWDQPQGVVHSNEFVANRFATANPNVLPVLNLIDAAQKSGTIANLSGEQIAAVASGGVKANQTTANNISTNSMINAAAFSTAVNSFNNAVEKAAKTWQKPVPAYCYTHGKGGINEAMTVEEKIKKNAKR